MRPFDADADAITASAGNFWLFFPPRSRRCQTWTYRSPSRHPRARLHTLRSRLVPACMPVVSQASHHLSNRAKPAHSRPGAGSRVAGPRVVTRRTNFVRSSGNTTAMADDGVSFVSAAQAKEIDEKLMGPEFGFSIDQLMELAGLSVASALCEVYPPRSHSRVLVLCGPGNNGGDGLVAARHLFHFGYEVEVCYPKRTDRPIYNGLVTQLSTLGIPFVDAETLRGGDPLVTTCDVVVDALFGFSFTGAPRAPFDALLELLNPHNSPPPIVAVDIPSGWSVDEGDESGEGMRPELLVSLTAPKLGAKTFKGPHHFVGGRFVPPAIAEEFELVLPQYMGSDQCARVSGLLTPGGGGFGFIKGPTVGGVLMKSPANESAEEAKRPPGYWDTSSDEDE